ncbi:bifunctional DNA primase/polymerase [Streptomyces albogriseolus]|uniref:bifunctional DNA primase/polymerase n=1 Tax=Streptomyces albogriseolus TaxID=1887 RepID=UPI0037F2E8AF
MTQPATIRRASGARPPLTPEHLRTALSLAASGVPVLPLRRGKVPFGNCPACVGNACGGRPNMKTPGPCLCLDVCHAWAAATTTPDVITSPAWAAAWRRAVCVGYHPGGAGLTVVDLDDADAVAWARKNLPGTRTVATTRGEHWIYRGVMASRNAVRPGVDIKSAMAYARYLGSGTGPLVGLPDTVRLLAVAKPPTTPAAMPAVVAPTGDGACPHRTPAYLERGVEMAVDRISEARAQVHATVYRVFLAVLSRHGRCGCLTDAHIARLFTAAQTKGESVRHCMDAWANARTRLGL